MERPAQRYYRKVIKIKAEDSPNVQLMLEQQRLGLPVTYDNVVDGVLTAEEYLFRRATWDKIRQCIGLDAEFWEGADELMYPPEWLTHSENKARLIDAGNNQRSGGNRTFALGIDPAEGGDDTAWAIVNSEGLHFLISYPTPNTSVIVPKTLALMREWNIPPERVVFDRGGGGKGLADTLREHHRCPVRTVAFGESVTPEPKRGMTPFVDRIDEREERSVYVNRRAQMYYDLRDLINPDGANGGFGIPAKFAELRRQLAPIPIKEDREGRRMMLPKAKKNPKDPEITLTDLIGRSPDQADALVLAVHALLHKAARKQAGAVR